MRKWSFFKEQKRVEEGKVRYILSIDGGGMRGIVPSIIIDKLTKDLKALGDDRPFYSHFDLIAGTSTGGLIALALSCPLEGTRLKREDGEDYIVKREETVRHLFRRERLLVPCGKIERLVDPAELVNIYKKNGDKIFYASQSILKKLAHVVSEKYSAEHIEAFLDETYGDTALRELRVPTAVVAFDPLTSSPYIFRSYDSHSFLVKEAARATSAAPTYFREAVYIDRETDEIVKLVDGGIAANNPALIAYREAKALYPDTDEFRMLSLSTCSPFFSFDPTNNPSGVAGWAGSLFQSYGSASMRVADEIASTLPDLSYTRLWKQITKEKIKMDDTSEESLKILEQGAEELYSENREILLSYLDSLSKRAINGQDNRLYLPHP